MTATRLEIMATRCAKRHVAIDSSICAALGCTVAIMAVRQLPPRLSRSTVVSVLLRYGTWPRRSPIDRSCSATITCSRYDNDKLMYCAQRTGVSVPAAVELRRWTYLAQP